VGRASHVFISIAVMGMALEFRVIWEVEIEADSPKEAAQDARAFQLTPGMSAPNGDSPAAAQHGADRGVQ
jgi:hypothetical protein